MALQGVAIKDVLLALTSYPEPSFSVIIDKAVDFAAAIDARLSAIACEVRVPMPGSPLGDAVFDIQALASLEAQKSRASAEKLLATFEQKAAARGVFRERIFDKCLTSELADLFVDYAKLRDLTIIGTPEHSFQEYWFAEAIIFGSGRPTLLMPAQSQSERPFALDHVVVAWDFSRTAARAVADALPLLVGARQVSVVTVSGEKKIDSKRSGEELARYLAEHGANVVLEDVKAKGHPIGEVLEAYVTSVQADLLVMGAYGHSRLREFVLGGATRSVLSHQIVPVMLSH
jgi:nucleotide-binding universal stress UspA family protein